MFEQIQKSPYNVSLTHLYFHVHSWRKRISKIVTVGSYQELHRLHCQAGEYLLSCWFYQGQLKIVGSNYNTCCVVLQLLFFKDFF